MNPDTLVWTSVRTGVRRSLRALVLPLAGLLLQGPLDAAHAQSVVKLCQETPAAAGGFQPGCQSVAAGAPLSVQVQTALPTGANTIGTVGLTAAGYDVGVSVTRPADTSAYAANDVIGAATGSTAALTFAALGSSGGAIMITSAELEIDITALPAGMTSFKLACYSVTPPSALGDNAAWDLPAGDRASFLGTIELGTPVDLGSTLYIRTDGINSQMRLASASLFCYLVTVGAYTPASGTVAKVTLHAVGL